MLGSVFLLGRNRKTFLGAFLTFPDLLGMSSTPSEIPDVALAGKFVLLLARCAELHTYINCRC